MLPLRKKPLLKRDGPIAKPKKKIEASIKPKKKRSSNSRSESFKKRPSNYKGKSPS